MKPSKLLKLTKKELKKDKTNNACFSVCTALYKVVFRMPSSDKITKSEEKILKLIQKTIKGNTYHHHWLKVVHGVDYKLTEPGKAEIKQRRLVWIDSMIKHFESCGK